MSGHLLEARGLTKRYFARVGLRREPLLAQRLRKKAGAVQKRAQEARRAGERGRLAAQRLEEQIALLLWAAEKIEGEQLPRSGGERKAGPCI